jgi:hypothetical protein
MSVFRRDDAIEVGREKVPISLRGGDGDGDRHDRGVGKEMPHIGQHRADAAIRDEELLFLHQVPILQQTRDVGRIGRSRPELRVEGP